MVLGVETSVSVRTCAANHMKSHVKYDLRTFGFAIRVVNTWSSLPNCVVSANTTKTLKARFDKLGTIRIQDIYNFRV